MTEVTLTDGTTIELNQDNVVFGTEVIHEDNSKTYRYLLVTGNYIETSTKL